jgi:hypothetical protein
LVGNFFSVDLSYNTRINSITVFGNISYLISPSLQSIHILGNVEHLQKNCLGLNPSTGNMSPAYSPTSPTYSPTSPEYYPIAPVAYDPIFIPPIPNVDGDDAISHASGGSGPFYSVFEES